MVADVALALLAAPLGGAVAAAPVEVAVFEVLDETVGVGFDGESLGGRGREVGGGSVVRHCGGFGD